MEISWDLNQMSQANKDYIHPSGSKKADNTTKIDSPFYIINTGQQSLCNIKIKPVIQNNNSIISDPSSPNDYLKFNSSSLNWIQITDNTNPLNI
jgi:hypothetical protein